MRLLKRDLLNGPNHCFGNYQHCSPDFCSTARDRLQISSAPATSVSDKSGAMEMGNDDIDDLACKFHLAQTYIQKHTIKRLKM